jgi:hypothetical protein
MIDESRRGHSVRARRSLHTATIAVPKGAPGTLLYEIEKEWSKRCSVSGGKTAALGSSSHRMSKM